jgi:hypothetical protein
VRSNGACPDPVTDILPFQTCGTAFGRRAPRRGERASTSSTSSSMAKVEPEPIATATSAGTRATPERRVSFSDETRAETSKCCARTSREKILEYLDLENRDKMGFTPDAHNELKWRQAVPQYMSLPRKERLMVVVKRFPGYWLHHNLLCVPLIMATLIPLLLTGLKAQAMIDGQPHKTGTFKEFEYEPPNAGHAIIQLVQRNVSTTADFMVLYVAVITMWSRKIVTPVAVKWLLPFWLLAISLSTIQDLYRSTVGYNASLEDSIFVTAIRAPTSAPTIPTM